MYILVTGATGFIGKKVVLQLAKRNINIIAADIDLGKNKDNLIKEYQANNFDIKNLTFEKLDITIQENIDTIFNKYNFDSVIHLAYGIGMICENNPLLASKINITGTTSIFEKIAQYKLED